MTFSPATPTGVKVKCDTCGAKGYPGGPWQAKHHDHPEQCGTCGRRFADRYGIGQHRRRHPECVTQNPA